MPFFSWERKEINAWVWRQEVAVEAGRGIVYERLYIQWEVETLTIVLNTFSQISLKGTLEMAIFYCI